MTKCQQVLQESILKFEYLHTVVLVGNKASGVRHKDWKCDLFRLEDLVRTKLYHSWQKCLELNNVFFLDKLSTIK